MQVSYFIAVLFALLLLAFIHTQSGIYLYNHVDKEDYLCLLEAELSITSQWPAHQTYHQA